MRHLLSVAALAAVLFAPASASAVAPQARVIVAFKPEAAALRGEKRPLAAEPMRWRRMPAGSFPPGGRWPRAGR
jgi:hypothetical protein